MRGLEKVNIEFALMAIVDNLRKWAKKEKNTSAKTPLIPIFILKTSNTYKIFSIK